MSPPNSPIGTMRTVDGIQIWSGGFPKEPSLVVAYGITSSEEVHLIKLAKELNADAIVMDGAPFTQQTLQGNLFMKRTIFCPLLVRYVKPSKEATEGTKP